MNKAQMKRINKNINEALFGKKVKRSYFKDTSVIIVNGTRFDKKIYLEAQKEKQFKKGRHKNN